jgi:hypothetical protein
MADDSTGRPPIKPYTVSDIKSKLLRPSLTSHYICKFQPPTNASFSNFIKYRTDAGFEGLNYADSETQSLIELSCSEASLPGSSLATYDINDSYHGVSEKIVYRRLYDDRADFTFYVDSDYKIIQFFENWMSYITQENDIQFQEDTRFTYRSEFKSNYQTNKLFITKFERDYGGRALTYQFIGAYPISINSMPISYDSSQLLKCTVSFSYLRYVMKPSAYTPPPPEPSNPPVNRGVPLTGFDIDNTGQLGQTGQNLTSNRSNQRFGPAF